TRHPPPHTLFPYTTLFRSRSRVQAVHGDARANEAAGELAREEDVHQLRLAVPRHADQPVAVGPVEDVEAQLAEAMRVRGHVDDRSEEHTSELQSRFDLVCR